MIEVSGSRSVPLTNESGSRPKNPRIPIHNTDPSFDFADLYIKRVYPSMAEARSCISTARSTDVFNLCKFLTFLLIIFLRYIYIIFQR
jgi:hypothetical protein